MNSGMALILQYMPEPSYPSNRPVVGGLDWTHAGVVQDLPHCAGGDLIAETDQFTVAPAMPQEEFSVASRNTKSRICVAACGRPGLPCG
jgi:hypothetical protein